MFTLCRLAWNCLKSEDDSDGFSGSDSSDNSDGFSILDLFF